MPNFFLSLNNTQMPVDEYRVIRDHTFVHDRIFDYHPLYSSNPGHITTREHKQAHASHNEQVSADPRYSKKRAGKNREGLELVVDLEGRLTDEKLNPFWTNNRIDEYRVNDAYQSSQYSDLTVYTREN